MPASRRLPPYRRRGVLFVLSGPSGVGKDAVLTRVRQEACGVVRITTATTRPAREGEKPGTDYHFWTENEFRDRVLAGDLLEWAEVYGNLYGTPRAAVERAIEEGNSVILKIDVQGAASVRRAAPGSVHIFLAPPSLEELERRLRERRTDSEEAVARRLSTALHEMEQLPDFDYVVVNDELEKAVHQVCSIIEAEGLRTDHIEGRDG